MVIFGNFGFYGLADSNKSETSILSAPRAMLGDTFSFPLDNFHLLLESFSYPKESFCYKLCNMYYKLCNTY